MNLRKTFLALAAMILGVGLFGVSPALAVTETAQKFNNTWCWLRTGGTYPENGYFQYCTFQTPPAAEDTTHGQIAVTRMKSLNGPQAKNGFYSTKGIRIIVHESPLTYADANGLNRQAEWNKTEESFFLLNNKAIILYRNVKKPGGVYPELVSIKDLVDHNTRHESGHVYDLLKFSSKPSNSQLMRTLAAKDRAYMQANDPNYAQDIVTYDYWLKDWSSVPNDPRDGYEELFAEQWARATGSSEKPVDTILTQYWLCTFTFTNRYYIADVPPTTAQLPTRCR